jgi:hypothetical protein
MSNIDIGDGWVICDKNVTLPKDLVRTGDIILTKLNNYIPFLSKNNIAAIKIDVEGSEGKAIEGGIELIKKYHVPFNINFIIPMNSSSKGKIQKVSHIEKLDIMGE